MNDYQRVNYHPGRLLRFFRRLAWFFSVYLPPIHDVTITTRNGILTFNSKDKTTGRILYIARNHEFDDMMNYVALLRKEKLISANCEGTLLDVGGYIGMSSTAFLLEDIFATAVAFEPSPENFRLLNKNIKNNHLESRMHALNVALSDQDGSLQFELSPKNYGDHRVRKYGDVEQGFYDEHDRTVIEVPARTLDSISEQELGIELKDVRLVWMDIQGHEAKFLKGAQNFLKSHKQVPVIMEFWPYAIKRSGVSRAEFIKIVEELFSGYYLLVQQEYQYYTIDTVGSYFDKEDDPEKGSTLVLVNHL